MKPIPLYRNILISEEIDSGSVKAAISKIITTNRTLIDKCTKPRIRFACFSSFCSTSNKSTQTDVVKAVITAFKVITNCLKSGGQII